MRCKDFQIRLTVLHFGGCEKGMKNCNRQLKRIMRSNVWKPQMFLFGEENSQVPFKLNAKWWLWVGETNRTSKNYTNSMALCATTAVAVIKYVQTFGNVGTSVRVWYPPPNRQGNEGGFVHCACIDAYMRATGFHTCALHAFYPIFSVHERPTIKFCKLPIRKSK